MDIVLIYSELCMYQDPKFLAPKKNLRSTILNQKKYKDLEAY